MKKKLLKIIEFIAALLILNVLESGLRVLVCILQGEHGAPSFVSPAFLTYGTISQILFILAYYLLGKYIPIKNKILRGLMFTFLFWISDYFPQVMGMTGGESTLLSAEAMSIPTIVVDSIAYFLKGIVLGHFIIPKGNVEKRNCNKKKYIIACFSSMIIFSTMLGIFEVIAGNINEQLFCIHSFEIMKDTYLSFYIIFYLFQALSGLIIPVFYRLSEYNRDSCSWIRFAVIYGVLLWLPVVLIVIFFGVDPIITIVWGIMMIFAIFIDSFIFTKLIKISTEDGKSDIMNESKVCLRG